MDRTTFWDTDVYKNFPKVWFCHLSCESCIKDCRESWFSLPPKFTTVRVNTLIASVDQVIALMKELLTEEALKRGLPEPRVFQHAKLSDCLVICPWLQEKDLDRHEREVIVDPACGTAVLRGANVFAPGVMGLLPGTQEGEAVSIYADSASHCKRGMSVQFSDPGKVFVGNGVMKMSRKSLFEKDLHPKGVAVEVTQTCSAVAAVSISQQLGLLQNLPSMVCGHVVSPQPGDKVIDLCAAPGHKTTHLAALMENKGVLVALDKIPRKIAALRSLCQSMQAECVRAFTYDSAKAVCPTPGADWSPPYAPDTFDHVLLDAPCSALGKRPQIGCKISNKQIASHPKLQRKLFMAAAQLVRPGGSLVYSTCSLTTEENEDMVGWALATFPQLQLVPAEPFLGKPGYPTSCLSEPDCRKVQRFGPPLGPRPEDDTIGFFIAKFTKIT